MQPFNPDSRKHLPGTFTMFGRQQNPPFYSVLTLLSMFPPEATGTIVHLPPSQHSTSISNERQSFLEHSPQILLHLMLSSVHLEKVGGSTLWVTETWQRPPLLIISPTWKTPRGTQENKKLFSLSLMLIDLSSSLEASLNVLLSCVCFVAGVQKRILQIDLSSQPLLGMDSYYCSFSGLSSQAHIPSHR